MESPKNGSPSAGGIGEESSLQQPQTTYRDASGRKIDIKLAEMQKKAEQRRKEDAAFADQQMSSSGQSVWGKQGGLEQASQREAYLQALRAEKGKPFSRSKDDPEMNILLKSEQRWDDPMKESSKVTMAFMVRFDPFRKSPRPATC